MLSDPRLPLRGGGVLELNLAAATRQSVDPTAYRVCVTLIGTLLVVWLAHALFHVDPSRSSLRISPSLNHHSGFSSLSTDVVISVTTTPIRILDFPRVAALWDLQLTSLLNVSRIIVSVPRTLRRTGEPYPDDVMGEWRKRYGPALDQRLFVNTIAEDAGPLSKWVGVTSAGLHPDDVLFIVDDDMHYGLGHLRRIYDALLLAESTLRSRNRNSERESCADHDSSACLTPDGSVAVDGVVVAAAGTAFSYVMNHSKFPRYAGLHSNVSVQRGWPATPLPLLHDSGMSLRHDAFDFIEAFGGVALRARTLSPGFVRSSKELSLLNKECWASDDIVVSAAFAANRVPLLQIYPRPPFDANFHDRPFGEEGALGLKNDSGGHNAKYPVCAQAIDGVLRTA